MTSSVNNKPLRVVMILGSMPPLPMGGAEVQAMLLCKQLNKIGVDTKVITYGKFWHSRKGSFDGINFTRLSSLPDLFADLLSLLRPKKKKSSVKIVYDDTKDKNAEISGNVWIGMRSRYSLFYLNALACLWWKRKSFDFIHAHMMEWPAFTAVRLGKKLNKPVVIKDSTMNGIFSLLRYPAGEKKQSDIIQYAWCVAMTGMIRQNLLTAGVPANRIVNIPNGIPVNPMPEKVKPWSNRVVFVGNLTQQPAKGIDILLFAWKNVTNKFPDASLEIIGNGDIDAYNAFVQSNGIANVTFAGKQSNVKERLPGFDIFVLPSRREGMSNALMEAMLCGLPVVATNVSGSQDLIEHHVSGVLVPVSDIAALSEALIYMMIDPARAMEMGKKAYESVIGKCDIKIIAAAYKDLYNKILAEA